MPNIHLLEMNIYIYILFVAKKNKGMGDANPYAHDFTRLVTSILSLESIAPSSFFFLSFFIFLFFFNFFFYEFSMPPIKKVTYVKKNKLSKFLTLKIIGLLIILQS
jgi:hypothetical protein